MACRTMQLRFFKLGTVLTYAFKVFYTGVASRIIHNEQGGGGQSLFVTMAAPPCSLCIIRARYASGILAHIYTERQKNLSLLQGDAH